eukprot:gene28171-37072_t
MQTYPLKIILVGESRVGKSQLARSFMGKEFRNDAEVTVGMEFSTRSLAFEKCTVKSMIWDTAGQERFESMSKAYYRDAAGVLLVYDICNKNSFEKMKTTWLTQIRNFADENIRIILVGNKFDKVIENPGKREVSVEEATEFALQENIDFLEASAYSGAAVETAFRRVIFSIAKLIPDVIVHLDLNGLPSGWITCPFPQLQRAQTSSYVVTSSLSMSSEPPPAKQSPEQTTSLNSANFGCCSSHSGENITIADGNSVNSNNSSNNEIILSLNQSGSDQDVEECNPENFSLSRSRRRSCSIELTGFRDDCSPKSSPRTKSVSIDECFVDPFMDVPSTDVQDNAKSDCALCPTLTRGSNPSSPRSPIHVGPIAASVSSSYKNCYSTPVTPSPPSGSSPTAGVLSLPPRDVLLKKSFSSSNNCNSKLKPECKPLSRAVSYSSHQSKRSANSSSSGASTYIPPAACGYLNYWTGEVQVDYPKDPAIPHLLFAARRTTSLQMGQQIKESMFERRTISTTSSKTLSLRDPDISKVASGKSKERRKELVVVTTANTETSGDAIFSAVRGFHLHQCAIFVRSWFQNAGNSELFIFTEIRPNTRQSWADYFSR